MWLFKVMFQEIYFQYFMEHIHRRYSVYFIGYICCEFLNFGMVLMVFHMTDHFLNYRFHNYGIRVWNYYQLLSADQHQDYMITNPMCYTFPRIAACDYHRYIDS